MAPAVLRCAWWDNVPEVPWEVDGITSAEIQVLVVEDNPQLSTYLRLEVEGGELLPGRSTTVEHSPTLAGALGLLDEGAADLILLDLELPDSAGLDTLLQVVDRAPALPIVVITGTQDVGFGEQAILAGAHDFLVKGAYTSADLLRCLRFTFARHRRFLSTLDVFAQLREDEDQLAVLESLGASGAGVTSRSLGRVALSESFPDAFNTSVERYSELVTLKAEEKGLRVDYQVSAKARALAGDLGLLRVTPRDVVDLHLDALRSVTSGRPRPRARVLLDVGEIVLVEVLGHLAAHYRAQALGHRLSGEIELDQPSEVGSS